MKNNRLITLREEKGLTQIQLAQKLGISQSMISLGERGEREFDDPMKVKIADFFGVTVQWLFFDQRYYNSQLKTNNPDDQPDKEVS